MPSPKLSEGETESILFFFCFFLVFLTSENHVISGLLVVDWSSTERGYTLFWLLGPLSSHLMGFNTKKISDSTHERQRATNRGAEKILMTCYVLRERSMDVKQVHINPEQTGMSQILKGSVANKKGTLNHEPYVSIAIISRTNACY
jgi:hypothetical protein